MHGAERNTAHAAIIATELIKKDLRARVLKIIIKSSLEL